MADTNLEIVINGRDNFSATANRVIGSLNGINSAAGRVGRGVGQLGMGLARVGVTAGVALAGGLAYAAKQAIGFEDAFAGVRKTADLSEAEFTKLAGSFRKMATEIPITANELARLGETAGALGISGVENIREFSRVTALLGVTTNLTADAAAEALGHISTILGITGKDYERFASALVDLGNKGASTEDQIAAIAERAAGGASTIHLSTQALLGWSAAIANIGVEAEAGGTNFQKFLIESARFTAEAGGELETLAKVAGMTGEAWKKQFGTDPNSALTQFVVGLGKLNTEQRILALGTLGWDDQRMARILLGLASNTGNLTAALNTSGTAWQANTALSVEAGKRFDTLKSKLTVLRNNFVEAAMIVGEGFTPAIGRAAEKLTKFLGDEGNRNSLRQFGEDIGRAIDGINWGEVIAGAKTFWTITKSILDVLMALPNEVKAAGAAFIGLNKLSGGLIGQGVGNIFGGLAGGAARGIAAKVPGIGSIFAQPVYVTNWPPSMFLPGGGGGGRGPTDIVDTAVKGGILAKLASFFTAGAGFALAGIGGILAAYQLPVLFRGPEGSGITSDVTTAAGNVVPKTTRETFASVMPGFENLLAQQGAKPSGTKSDPISIVESGGGKSPDERAALAAAAAASVFARNFGTHEAATGAFGSAELKAFRGGDVSLLPERVKYLSGAQGAGAGSESFLALVGRDIAALKADLPNATGTKADEITAAIVTLQGILEAKKFEMTPETLAAVASKTDKTYQDLEDRRAMTGGDTSYELLERSRLNRPDIKNDIRLNPITNVTVNLSWRDVQTRVTTQSRIGPATGSAGGGRSLAYQPS
jgi:TP901 family phage tail tape measure protein